MKTLRFGLLGAGAMGTVIADHLKRRWKGRSRLSWVYDRDGQAAERLAEALGIPVLEAELAKGVAGVDWVIEAASVKAVCPLLRLCIKEGKNLMVMSSGGLIGCGALLKRAQGVGARILVPSGAIAGLDGIRAAGLGQIRSLQITTRKPPRGLEGAPYLRRKRIRLADMKEAQIIFQGNAKEAMEGFPANVNVAATLALAAGLPPQRVNVKIVADPGLRRNVHEVCVQSSTGSLRTVVENVPSSTNPKTSALAVLSACAAIDGIFSSVRVGT